MSHLTASDLARIKEELAARYYMLTQTLQARIPTAKTDGAGRGYWVDPENVRILESTTTERKLAVDDFSSILRRIAAIK